MFPEDWLDILVRMAAAVACGAIVGFEREFQSKPAGLRTHMMVALGAASFTLVTLQIFDSTVKTVQTPRLGTDPLRVVSGVIGGIGFLGAGTIIQSRTSVQGITTAATIWVTGSVGIACGIGYYIVALFTVAFSLLILLGVGGLGFLIAKYSRAGDDVAGDTINPPEDEGGGKSHRGRTYTSRDT